MRRLFWYNYFDRLSSIAKRIGWKGITVLTFVATCLFGLEHLLGEEITALGYKKIETIDGRVTFSGEIDAVARFNIFSRYAERLYIRLSEFNAVSFTELFDGVKRIPWEEWISRDDSFPVTGHSIKSTLFSVPDCQSIIKRLCRLSTLGKRKSCTN